MKNKKMLIYLFIGFIILAMVLGLGILMPRIMLNLLIKETLPEFVAAEYITDFSLLEENAIEIGNDFFTVCIPDSFQETNGSLDEWFMIYEDTKSERLYKIQKISIDVTMTVDDLDYQSLPESYLHTTDESMLNSLGYAEPDSYYNIMKCVSLLDAKDYDKWDMEKIMAYSVYGSIRMNLGEVKNYLYEREDLYAYVQYYKETGAYKLEFFQPKDLNTAYVVTIENGDLEDVTALLNSIQFH